MTQPPVSVPPSIERLLQRLLARSASEVEQQQVADWIAEDPEARQRYVDAVRLGGEVWGQQRSTFDRATAWKALDTRIMEAGSPGSSDAVDEQAPFVSPARRWVGRSLLGRGSSWSVPAAIAAGLMAVTFGAYAAMRATRHLVTIGRNVGDANDIVTAIGERASVELSDGTRVTLAPASRLRVPLSYGRGSRALALDGEAVFTVVHDAARPFTVTTHGVVTTDLGTRFDVRGYRGDNAVQVAVTDGRVAIHSLATPDGVDQSITAGGVATVGGTGTITLLPDADAVALASWTDGTLTPQNTALADVSQTLDRWYDVDITFADTTLGQKRLSGAFRLTSLSQVLNQVTRAVGARWEQRGRTIIVHS